MVGGRGLGETMFRSILVTVALVAPVGTASAGPVGPVTWGDTASIGGGWGRMAQLANGDWISVTTRFPTGSESYLRIRRSTNQARTWQTISEVKETGRTLDNGELVALPDGTLLLTMRSLIAGQSYRLPVYASGDGGASWTYRSNIDTSEGNGTAGLWEPDFLPLDDGRLAVTYSNETHAGYNQVISERISGDGGTTWGAETWAVAQIGGGNLRPGMSQVAKMGNGEFILVYEVVNSGRADVHCKFSADGVNWPPGIGTRVPLHHAGPFVASLPNGLALVSSCENELSYSEDHGRTWQKVEPPPFDFGYLFSWPAIYATGPDEIAVMTVPGGVTLRFGNVTPRPKWPAVWSDGFDDGLDQGWARYGGNFDLQNGTYLLNNEGTYGKAMAGDTFWRDGTLDANVSLSSPGDAGLMFRTTNPDKEGPDHAFGYYAGIDSNGFAVLGRMNNSWTALATAPAAASLNTWHHLRVELVGTRIRLFVDDMATPKIDITDASFARGQIGLRAFQCDAAFDNVSFANSIPMRLSIDAAGDPLRLTWPETAATVKLRESPDLTDDTPVPGHPTTTGGVSEQSVDRPTADRRFYWLRAE